MLLLRAILSTYSRKFTKKLTSLLVKTPNFFLISRGRCKPPPLNTPLLMPITAVDSSHTKTSFSLFFVLPSLYSTVLHPFYFEFVSVRPNPERSNVDRSRSLPPLTNEDIISLFSAVICRKFPRKLNTNKLMLASLHRCWKETVFTQALNWSTFIL